MAVQSIAFLGCCLALIATSSSSAQDTPAEKSESRLAAMGRRATQLKIRFADSPDRAPPELMQSPVLRTNDPTRNEVDGALWLWLDGKRPVAALGVMYYASGKWNYELR